MNYAKIVNFDTKDGEGMRVALYVSGCTLHCAGCFNREAWDFSYGKPFTPMVARRVLDLLANKHIAGLSILGGEPTESRNAPVLDAFLTEVKRRYPAKSIWMWTGRTYEILKDTRADLLRHVDVLVDGAFEEELADPSLLYRGSSNQRILKLANGKLVNPHACDCDAFLDDLLEGVTDEWIEKNVMPYLSGGAKFPFKI